MVVTQHILQEIEKKIQSTKINKWKNFGKSVPMEMLKKL